MSGRDFQEAQSADYAREDGITGYAWVARYTVHFLDAYLKHDAEAMAWLKKTPAENGVPAHVMGVSTALQKVCLRRWMPSALS